MKSQGNHDTLEPLVPIEVAATFLAVKPNTLRMWCVQRRVPFRKVGSRLRFKLSELDNWSEANTHRP